jgi:hypothetical protein
MIEITAEHVKRLNDEDLRSLVGLLCEAELKLQGIPSAGVKWGGDQRAADGGIDVKVEINTTPHKDGYVPKAITGFQVKTPDMPRSAILSEMKPNNELRDSIKELVKIGGAYIIISSNGSTSESALNDRKEAMRVALQDQDEPENLHIDFYDRTRIASWERSHPALILWVRKKIGEPIQGWEPYANWSNAKGGVEEEYITDDQIRLFDGTSASKDSGLKGVEMINKLRSKLSQPRNSVRLVGLSGVGKTRLVQALFDDRIGETTLNTAQVFYSDIGRKPLPDPQKLAEQIIALRTRAILVVDNCSPELHRQLNNICTSSESLISLITVEYDVRDDQPEETHVFRLEPASNDLIEKMVRQRFNHINQVDARTIAEFSGGNARIAIALAETIESGETLADLKDEELFKRLFYQRNDPNNQLLSSAETCSLVYSFDSRTEEESNKEMQLLSEFAGSTLLDLHRDIAELKRRQLIQQRNYWKAVLPHAIANRLAKKALENIPIEMILGAFEKPENERLLISFSRRLGYLHDSEIAIQVAEKWLSEDGLIGNLEKLNDIGLALLKNIAPIKPEVTLRAIERAAESENGQLFTSRENRNYVEITRLLCSLAYDSELFERSLELLVRFALSENEDENVNSIRSQLKSLFLIYLSGTHATAKQRLDIIRKLIFTDSKNANQLGFELLRSAFQSSNFFSSNQFAFGARSRDAGLWPKTRKEAIDWYSLFVGFSVELAISEEPNSEQAKLILAESFRGLWTNIKLYDELEEATERILEKGSWKEGWVGIRKTLRFDSKNMHDETLSRLKVLESKSKPSALLDKARLYAFSKHGSSLDLPDNVDEEEIEKESKRYRLIGEAAQSVGKEVAQNEEILFEILPELVQKNGAWSLNFGQGLAEGISDSEDLWGRFKEQLEATDADNHNYQVIRGYLNHLSQNDPEKSDKLLDNAVEDEIFGTVFPYLQTSMEIDEEGVRRLLNSLELGIAPIHIFKNLAYGRAHESIVDDALVELIKAIAAKENGIPVAIEILHMRFHGIKQSEYVPKEELINLGRRLLNSIELDRNKNTIRSEDYTLSEIIKVCFNGENAKDAAQVFCERIAKAITEYNLFVQDFSSVYEALIQEQPIVFLNSFYGENNDINITRLVWSTEFREDPLSKIDDDTLMKWCEENPAQRYPIIARAITPFKKEKGATTYEWTDLAKKIMNECPEPGKVLSNFKARFSPTTWTPPLSSILQSRLPLISKLKDHENPEISEWAYNAEIAFEKEISFEREREKEREKNREESYGFE